MTAEKRQSTIKHKSKHLIRNRQKKRITKREMLDETKRLLMEEDIMTNCGDADDDRMDFLGADDEEITDKVVRKFKQKRRKLKASEIDKYSHGMVENLKESMLSQIMDPSEYQIMRESQRDFSYHMPNKPQSKRKYVLRSLLSSERSANTIRSGQVIQEGTPLGRETYTAVDDAPRMISGLNGNIPSSNPNHRTNLFNSTNNTYDNQKPSSPSMKDNSYHGMGAGGNA